MNRTDSRALETSRPPACMALARRVGGVREAPLAVLSGTVLLAMLPVTMMVPVLKEIAADRLGGSALAAHAFMSVNMIAAVVVGPILAWFADALTDRRRLLAASALAHSLILLLMSSVDSLEVLLFLRFLEGAAHITALTTLMALAADHAAPGRAGRVMGLVGASMMFGTALGMPLGGWIGRLEPTRVFVAGALLSGGLALSAALIVPAEVQRRGGGGGIGAVLRVCREAPVIASVWAFAFVDRFCVGVIVSSFVLFLAQSHGMDPAARGGLLAMFMIPFAALCYPSGRVVERVGPWIPLACGSAGFGVLMMLYGVLPTAWLGAAMLLSGVCSALMFPPTLTLCGRLAPDGQRGAAFAGFNAAGSLGFLAGPMLGGALVIALGDSNGSTPQRTAFVLAGALELACAGAAWLAGVRMRAAPELREAPPAEKRQAVSS